MSDLEKAQKKYEQAKARLTQLKTLATQRERKQDARRKIILGGIVINLMKTDISLARAISAKIALLPERDRSLFLGLFDDKEKIK